MASTLMRRVRSGDSDRPAITPYSKKLIPASRCNCSSSAEGNLISTLARASQVCLSSVSSQRVSRCVSMPSSVTSRLK